MRRARALWTLTRKELAVLGRDPHTLLYSVLLPLFLYPGLVWGITQAGAYIQGLGDRVVDRALVVRDPALEGAGGEALVARLREGLERRKLAVEVAGAGAEVPDPPGAAALAVRDARHEVVIELAGGGDPLDGLDARVVHTTARIASVRARARVEEALEELRGERLEEAVTAAGGDPSLLETAALEEDDVSTPEELTGWVASMILPVVLILMGALGSLYPALEVGVGEKERGTIETTLLLPVAGAAIAAGKYVAVVCFAFVSFSLNLASMAFTLSHLGSQAKMGALSLSPSSLLLVGAVGLILSASMASFMLILGFLARSFREGQSYLSGVYVVVTLLAAFSGSRDVALDGATACIPILNLALVVREGLRGAGATPAAALALGVSALYGAVLLALASRILHRESAAGLGGRRWRGRRPRGDSELSHAAG